jgi:hypothetical protein
LTISNRQDGRVRRTEIVLYGLMIARRDGLRALEMTAPMKSCTYAKVWRKLWQGSVGCKAQPN